VEQLGETVKHVSAEAVELVTQQVAVGESLQEAHAEALDAQLAGLAAAQEQLHGHVDGLRELMQAVAGDVTNVAREQATLQEAVETGGEESVRRLETLSEDHRNVHNHLDRLGENVKQASAEAAEIVAQRVASHESFQAHAEAIEAQMSGLGAAQERLESSVNAAKVNLEKITEEQASLHGTLQDNTSTVATTMGLIEQFQQTLQGEIGNLAQASRRTIASIEEMTVEQASLREIAGRKNDELTGQIAAFSEDQKAALAAFGDDLQQTATDMASIARNQDHIEDAVSSTCQESLSKLDAITDDQEHRGRQLEANEARANEMVANIGKLQQQVAAVLEMLNTCTQSLTDVLDSNNEQQFKLEDTINQNLTAIADLISQIQANRASLEDQM
jgi:DNA repair exonuclease SbcCD ATPase subunit